MSRSPIRLVPEPYRKLARAAVRSGWRIERTGRSGHVAWISPEGRTVFAPTSPSDFRSYKNVITKLRHAGLNERTLHA